MGSAASGELSISRAIEWLSRPEPCLVMYGAGASLSAPTHAPSVPAVLETTLDIVERAARVSDDAPRTPQGGYDWSNWSQVTEMSIAEALDFRSPSARPDRMDGRFRQRLLPESCYGSIATAFRTSEHLRLWHAFAWSTDDASDVRVPQPNLGHLLGILLAWRSQLPILTSNFDCFLERAATLAGLRPVVGLPSVRGFDARRATAGEVAIWKLHGSADSEQTVFSQSADLARNSYFALH